MLQTIESVNSVINNFIWGVPAMICIMTPLMMCSVYRSVRSPFRKQKLPMASIWMSRYTSAG